MYEIPICTKIRLHVYHFYGPVWCVGEISVNHRRGNCEILSERKHRGRNSCRKIRDGKLLLKVNFPMIRSVPCILVGRSVKISLNGWKLQHDASIGVFALFYLLFSENVWSSEVEKEQGTIPDNIMSGPFKPPYSSTIIYTFGVSASIPDLET